MIATILNNNGRLSVAVRREYNTLERCLDVVNRPNTLPYVIHSLHINDHQVLVSLSQFDKETNELDVVMQELFDNTDTKAMKHYSEELLFVAKDMHFA